MRRVTAFSFVLTFILFGCGHTPPLEPEIEVERASVAVAAECTSGERDERPEWPDNHDSIWGAPNPGERQRLLLLGLKARDAWINYLEGFYAGC